MRQMIDKITERYLQEREHILEQTIHDIIYWKTPKHGYRSREEMLSDKRYQELINTKFLLENDKIHPENDIRALGDDKMEIRYRWFYEKYFPEEMAELAAHYGQISAGEEKWRKCSNKMAGLLSRGKVLYK